MDLRFSERDTAFRDEVREWLNTRLSGAFRELRGWGAPSDPARIEAYRAWERELGNGGWIGLSWPSSHGGRGLSLWQEVIFYEEYVKANAPGRLGHIGETLLGPTLLAFGTKAQQERFLPPILAGEEIWCQGYSEPNAGSDLASLQCRAVRDDDQWIITGQKTWTSRAEWSDWCFVLCRTGAQSPKHKGISCLLVSMDQPNITLRPIAQITHDSEFCETFFDEATTDLDNVVGEVNEGWKVAMGTLAFERGASTLGQQLAFRNELELVIAVAKANGSAQDPQIRQRIADAWMGLEVMRLNALRTLTAAHDGVLSAEAMITKLVWSNWHRDLGELAMDVIGVTAEILDGTEGDYPLSDLQRLFLWTRCDTIYAGSNEIQRNIIGERALGLPRGPK